MKMNKMKIKLKKSKISKIKNLKNKRKIIKGNN